MRSLVFAIGLGLLPNQQLCAGEAYRPTIPQTENPKSAPQRETPKTFIYRDMVLPRED